jgi:hypothetical protein
MGGRWGRRSRLGLEILESYIVSYNTFHVRLLFVTIPLQYKNGDNEDEDEEEEGYHDHDDGEDDDVDVDDYYDDVYDAWL